MADRDRNEALAWMRAVRDSDLESTTKHVLLTLGTRMDPDGGNCYPSTRKLAADTGLSRRSVEKHVRRAVEHGWIERQERGRDDRVRWQSFQYLPRVPTLGKEVPQALGEGGSPSGADLGEAASSTLGKEVPTTSTSTSSETETDAETWAKREAWPVYLEELGGNGRQPSLTEKRRTKIAALYAEQLSEEDDPLQAFRKILRRVKDSDHHMSDRAFQMPESLFVNEERREKWTLKALDGTDPTGPSYLREEL